MGISTIRGFWKPALWAIFWLVVALIMGPFLALPFSHWMVMLVFCWAMVVIQIALKWPRMGSKIWRSDSHHYTLLHGDVYGLPIFGAISVYLLMELHQDGRGLWAVSRGVLLGGYILGLLISLSLEAMAMRTPSDGGEAQFDWEVELRGSKIFHTVFMLPKYVMILIATVAIWIEMWLAWSWWPWVVVPMVVMTIWLMPWLVSMYFDGKLTPAEHRHRA